MGSGRPSASSADQPKNRSMAEFQNSTLLSGPIMIVGTTESLNTSAKKEISGKLPVDGAVDVFGILTFKSFSGN